MTERNMSFFMKGQAKPIEDTEEVVSNRYFDAEGKPIPFVFRPISSERFEDLRKECTRRIPGKKGQPATEEFDSYRFGIKTGIESTVYPNFKNADLLKSFGVADPVEVVPKILETAGELNAWIAVVQRINQFDDDFEELLEDAKN